MQYRPEYLFLQLFDAIECDHGWCDEQAPLRHFQGLEYTAIGCHALTVIGYFLPGRLVDNRSDIGSQIPGICQPELIHCAEQHLQDFIRYILLQVKHA